MATAQQDLTKQIAGWLKSPKGRPPMIALHALDSTNRKEGPSLGSWYPSETDTAAALAEEAVTISARDANSSGGKRKYAVYAVWDKDTSARSGIFAFEAPEEEKPPEEEKQTSGDRERMLFGLVKEMGQELRTTCKDLGEQYQKLLKMVVDDNIENRRLLTQHIQKRSNEVEERAAAAGAVQVVERATKEEADSEKRSSEMGMKLLDVALKEITGSPVTATPQHAAEIGALSEVLSEIAGNAEAFAILQKLPLETQVKLGRVQEWIQKSMSAAASSNGVGVAR